jgi:hypothetical protein
LRLFGTYNVNSLGRKLDGDDPSSAIHNLFEGRFNDWQFGLIFQMPLGFREAYSEYRQAQIQVAKWTIFLRNQEQATAYQLQDSYRRIYQLVEEIAIQRARRRAAQQQLEAFQSLWEAGRAQTPEGRDVLTALLNAQRSFAEALRDEYIATSEYNIALAEFERDKGTLLRHNNVTIVEGPLPDCAKARASEHIRERSRGWVLQHAPRQPAPTVAPEYTPLPSMGEEGVLPLPRLLEGQRDLPPLPDTLPELPRPRTLPAPGSLNAPREQKRMATTFTDGAAPSATPDALGRTASEPFRLPPASEPSPPSRPLFAPE